MRRYPMEEATVIAASTVRKWLDDPTNPEAEASPSNSSIVLPSCPGTHLMRRSTV